MTLRRWQLCCCQCVLESLISSHVHLLLEALLSTPHIRQIPHSHSHNRQIPQSHSHIRSDTSVTLTHQTDTSFTLTQQTQIPQSRISTGREWIGPGAKRLSTLHSTMLERIPNGQFQYFAYGSDSWWAKRARMRWNDVCIAHHVVYTQLAWLASPNPTKLATRPHSWPCV